MEFDGRVKKREYYLLAIRAIVGPILANRPGITGADRAAGGGGESKRPSGSQW